VSEQELPRTHYSPDELAKMSSLSRRAVYNAIGDGRLPASRPQGTSRLLIKVEDAMKFLNGEEPETTLADNVIPLRRRT